MSEATGKTDTRTKRRIGYRGYCLVLRVVMDAGSGTTAAIAAAINARGFPLTEKGARRLLNEMRSLGLVRRQRVIVDGDRTYSWSFGEDEDRAMENGVRAQPGALLISLAHAIRALQDERTAADVGELCGCARYQSERMIRALREFRLVRIAHYRPRPTGGTTCVYEWDPGGKDAKRTTPRESRKVTNARYRANAALRRDAVGTLAALAERGSVFGWAQSIAVGGRT